MGAENAVILRDLGILADQAAEPVAPIATRSGLPPACMICSRTEQSLTGMPIPEFGPLHHETPSLLKCPSRGT